MERLLNENLNFLINLLNSTTNSELLSSVPFDYDFGSDSLKVIQNLDVCNISCHDSSFSNDFENYFDGSCYLQFQIIFGLI